MEIKRVAFKMKLKPGFEAEYKKRHDEIWPELVKLIKDSGVSEYSIFLDRETNILFAFQKQSGNFPNLENPGNPLVGNCWIILEVFLRVILINPVFRIHLFNYFTFNKY